MARLTLDPGTVSLVWLGGEPRERRSRDDAGADLGPKTDDQGRPTYKLPAVLVVDGEALANATVATAEPPTSPLTVGTFLKVGSAIATPYVGGNGRVAVSALVGGLEPLDLTATRPSRQAAD